jgi:hypothetical protein
MTFVATFISSDMSRIDQNDWVANAHVGNITALPVAPIGG